MQITFLSMATKMAKCAWHIHLCFNLIEFNYEILMRLIALEKQQQKLTKSTAFVDVIVWLMQYAFKKKEQASTFK